MTKRKMDPVVHFEMPYEDGKRMASFYDTVFGWQTNVLGDDMGGYILATTTESDEHGVTAGRPVNAGTINGGFFPRKADWPAQYPSVVIAVDDIREAMSKVTAAGGKVLGDPSQIPGVGSYVSFSDTEGNRVSMLQPNPGM
jgi:uncharacterized protein